MIGDMPLIKGTEMPTMPPVRIIRRTLFPPFRIGIRQLVLYHGVVTRDAVKYVDWFNAHGDWRKA